MSSRYSPGVLLQASKGCVVFKRAEYGPEFFGAVAGGGPERVGEVLGAALLGPFEHELQNVALSVQQFRDGCRAGAGPRQAEGVLQLALRVFRPECVQAPVDVVPIVQPAFAYVFAQCVGVGLLERLPSEVDPSSV